MCAQIDFTAAENIPEAHWEVRYTVDMTATRHIVEVRVRQTHTRTGWMTLSYSSLSSFRFIPFSPPPAPLSSRQTSWSCVTTSDRASLLLPSIFFFFFFFRAQVGSSETVSYEAGAGTFKFHTAGIELEGIKKR